MRPVCCSPFYKEMNTWKKKAVRGGLCCISVSFWADVRPSSSSRVLGGQLHVEGADNHGGKFRTAGLLYPSASMHDKDRLMYYWPKSILTKISIVLRLCAWRKYWREVSDPKLIKAVSMLLSRFCLSNWKISLLSHFYIPLHYHQTIHLSHLSSNTRYREFDAPLVYFWK